MKKLLSLGMILMVVLASTMGFKLPTGDIQSGDTFRAKLRAANDMLATMRVGQDVRKGSLLLAPVAGGADPYVADAKTIWYGTIGSTAVTAGDLVYFDGTDWELADADDNTKYAEGFAVNTYASADANAAIARHGVIHDTDAPYTQGTTYYLSATAGAITGTRPSTADNLMQVVGFGLSTTDLAVEIAMPREVTIWVDLPYAETNSAVTIDADWGGLSFLTDADGAHGTQQFPENTVGLVIAYFWHYNEDTLASGGITVDVSAGKSSDTGTTTTDGITDTALAVVTNDDIGRVDITAGFNAAGIVEPGNHFGVDIAKASETAADDFRAHGVAIVLLVV